MNDLLTLREKHEYEYEIEQLKADIERHVNHKSEIKVEHEKEVKKLNVYIRSLQASRSTYRVRCNAKTPRKESRTSKARVYVQAWIDGDKSLTFKQIGELFFLTISTIKKISHDLRHNKHAANTG